MLIYFVYYSLIGVSAFLVPKISEKKKLKIQFFILFLGLFLILALRHPSMGVDLQYGLPNGYLGMFQKIANSQWNTLFTNSFLNYDKGYVIFNKLIGIISKNQQWLLVGCAALSLMPIFIVYKKLSVNFEFSIIIYMSLTCFLMTFSGLRQACAIGICVGSFCFVKERKLIPFVMLVLLGWTFHTSAIVFLIVYPLDKIYIKKSWRFLTLILVLVIFIFRTPLFNLFAPLIKESAVPDNNGAFGLLIVFVCIYIFCIIFGNEDKDFSGLLNIFLFAIICQVFGNIYTTAGRIGFFFMPFLGLLLPKTMANFPIKGKNFITTLLVIIFVSYGMYSIYCSGSSWAQAYPYHFFWENV